MKLLLLLFILPACLSNSRNVPITGPFGGTAYVDPATVLEANLFPVLVKHGITDVDVDDANHDRSAFELEVFSRADFAPNFETTLQSVLNKELGLNGATVKHFDNPFRHMFMKFGHKETYYVYLNPQLMDKQIAQLARNTPNISLEDSPYD